MNHHPKVAGVVLAGGRAVRMDHQDKGLVDFKGRPMVCFVIDALAPVVDSVYINANRSFEHYQQFGFPIINDRTDSFDGPLAGVLATMMLVDAEVLLVIPCDSPFVTREHLKRLLTECLDNCCDAAVAFDGMKLHPVFFAVKTTLKANLQAYLASGQRKVATWLEQLNLRRVDFSQEPAIFCNVNTPAELAELEMSNGF